MCTKNIPESQVRRHCESVRALFVICTRVTTLHSCYMRMHWLSANYKRVVFLCTLLDNDTCTDLFFIDA